MLKQLTATLEQDEECYIAFCPEIPEANGQGKTKADALEDLASSIAFLLQCEWEETFKITDGKIRRPKVKKHEARRSNPASKTARLPVHERRRKPLKVAESR